MAPDLLRSKTVLLGLLLAAYQLTLLFSRAIFPALPGRVLASEVDGIRNRALARRSVRLECGPHRTTFVVQLQRLQTLAGRARFDEPPPEEINIVDRLVALLKDAESDGLIDASECERFISSSASRLPLDIR